MPRTIPGPVRKLIATSSGSVSKLRCNPFRVEFHCALHCRILTGQVDLAWAQPLQGGRSRQLLGPIQIVQQRNIVGLFLLEIAMTQDQDFASHVATDEKTHTAPSVRALANDGALYENLRAMLGHTDRGRVARLVFRPAGATETANPPARYQSHNRFRLWPCQACSRLLGISP